MSARKGWQKNWPLLNMHGTAITQLCAMGQKELLIKEVLHSHLTPEDQHFNRDWNLELPRWWVATPKARDK